MDERKIKRLLITLVAAIAVIMVAKFMMIKAATSLGNAANERKRSVAAQQAPAPIPDTSPVPLPESGAGAPPEDVTAPTSSVDAANP